MAHTFQLIDVFGTAAFSGNPLAVVHNADDLDTETMQKIARWLNFSETAFLVRPTTSAADYRTRIFTLEQELPFAGHPTLGSCHAWLSTLEQVPDRPILIQECGAGLVSLARDSTQLSFAAPALIKAGAVEESQVVEIAELLRIERDHIVDAEWADNGPGWIAVLLESADAVLALEPQRSSPLPQAIGVVGAYPDGSESAIELRAFISDQQGILLEDPVTGSLNASVAQWLQRTGRVPDSYIASQGTRLGRSGRITVRRDPAGTVWVGGATQILFSGEMDY